MKNLFKSIECPDFVYDNIILLGYGGSHSFGTNNDHSDIDLCGITIPPKEMMFPCLTGAIPGYGTSQKLFEQFEIDHVSYNGSSHDVCVFNIVKFFNMLLRSSPRMYDILFIPETNLQYSDEVFKHILKNKKLFFTKQCEEKFTGYAYSQYKKVLEKKNPIGDKRKKLIENFSYDTKYAYHCARLLLECLYIVKNNDLDISCNSSILNDIRNGQWKFDQFDDWRKNILSEIRTSYAESELPEYPNENEIRNVLHECIEMKYGKIF